MSMAVPFDTLEYARTLQEAGIGAPQAEAQARALADALKGSVAAPSELKSLENRLEARMDAMDARLGGRIDALGGRIDRLAGSVDTLKWLFGLLAALNIATFARLVIAS